MMSPARAAFIQRSGILKQTLAEPIMQDGPPTQIAHNERARFLRNGLAIISFNILEDFIKARIAEVLQHISVSPVAFSQLPAKLQEATLLYSLAGIDKIGERMRKDGQDWRTFVQTEAQVLSSSSGSPFTLSKYGMGYEQSNIQKGDIPEFLSYFHVEGGWQSIWTVTTMAGCSLMSPDQVFANAASRRHAAAHNPATHTPFADINDFCDHAKAIGMAFDMLISQAGHHLQNNLSSYISGTKVRPADLRFRFVRHTGGHYTEMDATNTRAIKRHTTETAAVTSIKVRRSYAGQMIVVLDFPGRMENWYTAF